MDMHPAYTQLLPDIQHPKRLMNQPRSSSALIFYWGIKQQFPQLDLHNIFFSNDYRREFRSLFKQQQLEDDATIYLNISSKYAPRDAPAGCENWFVMLNAPHLTANQNWEATIDAARKDIQRRLSDYLQADIAQLTACEAILTPALIQSRTSSYLGALYGTSSNRRLAAFLRHPNFSNRIRNLYFCGGSVHPGGGIPLCLLSAKIATELTPEP
jgi:phytoene dehydrogenase-like protein